MVMLAQATYVVEEVCVLVPVANAWNEPRGPAMDGEVREVWYYIYSGVIQEDI